MTHTTIAGYSVIINNEGSAEIRIIPVKLKDSFLTLINDRENKIISKKEFDEWYKSQLIE